MLVRFKIMFFDFFSLGCVANSGVQSILYDFLLQYKMTFSDISTPSHVHQHHQITTKKTHLMYAPISIASVSFIAWFHGIHSQNIAAILQNGVVSYERTQRHVQRMAFGHLRECDYAHSRFRRIYVCKPHNRIYYNFNFAHLAFTTQYRREQLKIHIAIFIISSSSSYVSVFSLYQSFTRFRCVCSCFHFVCRHTRQTH